jgi:hypothetical protein
LANEKNLVPNSARTPEERRENAKKAGVASGVARRKKRDIKKSLEALMDGTYTTENGEKTDGIGFLASTLFKIATDKNHKQVIKAQQLIFELLDMDKGADDKKRIKQALKLQEQEIELNNKRIEHFEDDKW